MREVKLPKSGLGNSFQLARDWAEIVGAEDHFLGEGIACPENGL
jgi:hypothetical protein